MPATAGWYAHGAKSVGNGEIDLDSNTIKAMLVTPGYIYDPAHRYIDNAANDSTDPSFGEIVATNYVGGFAGSGRKTLTIAAGLAHATLDYAYWSLTDQTWTTLGGATNATVGGIIVVKEVTDDTLSLLIAYLGITNRATNGTDFVVNYNSASEFGNLRMQA